MPRPIRRSIRTDCDTVCRAILAECERCWRWRCSRGAGITYPPAGHRLPTRSCPASVRRRRFAALGQSWDALLAEIRAAAPLLDQRLAGAEPQWTRPFAVSAIPYGYVARGGDELWRLGDQASVIPSFSGDGMSIALHSAGLAADLYLRGADAALYQRRLARDVGGAVRFATALSRLAVRRPAAFAIGQAARLLPGAMAAIVAMTRVPDAALRRAGFEAG